MLQTEYVLYFKKCFELDVVQVVSVTTCRDNYGKIGNLEPPLVDTANILFVCLKLNPECRRIQKYVYMCLQHNTIEVYVLTNEYLGGTSMVMKLSIISKLYRPYNTSSLQIEIYFVCTLSSLKKFAYSIDFGCKRDMCVTSKLC